MVGDVILEYDGTRIEDDNHLINQVGLTPIGKEVSITLLRKGPPDELENNGGHATRLAQASNTPITGGKIALPSIEAGLVFRWLGARCFGARRARWK